jgi:hypothetical protein
MDDVLVIFQTASFQGKRFVPLKHSAVTRRFFACTFA